MFTLYSTDMKKLHPTYPSFTIAEFHKRDLIFRGFECGKIEQTKEGFSFTVTPQPHAREGNRKIYP